MFKRMATDPDVLEMFDVLGIPHRGIGIMEACIFDGDDPRKDREVKFKDFLPRVLDMRDSEMARVVDVIEIQKRLAKDEQRALTKCEKIKLDPQGNVLLCLTHAQVAFYR